MKSKSQMMQKCPGQVQNGGGRINRSKPFSIRFFFTKCVFLPTSILVLYVKSEEARKQEKKNW